MEVINISRDISMFPNGITLCLGFFDGIHLGHQALMMEAVNTGFPVGILSFRDIDNVKKHKKGKFITPFDIKCEIFVNWGISYLLLFEFESYLKNLSKEEFVNEVLVRLNAKYVIVGEDYRFGKDAEGSALELKNLCEAKNIRVEIIKTLSMDGKKISSSRIAEFLNVGDIPSINKMLGSHYKIMGKVTVGLRNGAKIGFPTANINVSDDLLIPKNGVYATDIIIRGKRYRSMTNIGVHPTIAELIMPIPEVHIFDFSEDIYGLTVSLEFLSFIREEQRFNSLSELVKQLTLDRETAKNFREKRILK